MSEAKNSRKDPKSRPTDGARTAGVRNANPERVYVLVSKNDTLQGPEFYEDMGYEYVRQADPERMAGSRNRGESTDTVEYRGHVLMWISKQEHMRIVREGPYGDTGQKYADQIENRIVDKKSAARDSLRGLGANHGLSVVNETERPVSAFEG